MPVNSFIDLAGAESRVLRTNSRSDIGNFHSYNSLRHTLRITSGL